MKVLQGGAEKAGPTTSITSICKRWGKEGGCRFGKGCKFLHPDLPDKFSRCWICSSLQHRKADCPFRKDDETSSPEKGKESKGKGKGKSKHLSKGKEGNVQQQGGDGSTAAAKEEGPSVKAERVEESAPGAREQGGGEAAMINEVTNLLKSLRIPQDRPQLRVCQIRVEKDDEEQYALVDGGATHCLRQAQTQEEWDRAMMVKVQLAAGESEMRQDRETQTLLSLEKVQTIASMPRLAHML